MTETLSLLFAGDFAPCQRYEPLARAKSGDIFGMLREDLSKADIGFLNLETPLCTNGQPLIKAGPLLRSHPDCVAAIAEAGFTLVGLANNHIMDYGTDGLIHTLAACNSHGLFYCGAGKNIIDAQQPALITVRGITVAVLAIAEHEFSIATSDSAGAAPVDPIDNTHQIHTAKSIADIVIVTLHGGNEYFPYPRPGLRKLCRFLIDRGADAVICHHPHVPGPYEFFNDKPIVYSLGNLIFDHPSPPDGWNEGYAVMLNYSPESKALSSLKVLSYRQSVETGGVERLAGAAENEFLQKLTQYNTILADDDSYLRQWEDFCRRRKGNALMRQYFPTQIRGQGILLKLFDPARFLLGSRKLLSAKLNMLLCESHLELLQSILQQEHKTRR